MRSSLAMVLLGSLLPLLTAAAPAPSLDEQLTLAQTAYDELRYDELIPIVNDVLARADASATQRLRASLLQGSALAAMNRQIEAETAFRLLLRADPQWDMPADTPPKILAVFRKVQVEERAINAELAKTERERLIARMAVKGGPVDPRRVGGTPMTFRYALEDPEGVVKQLRLNFRQDASRSFSSVPLHQEDNGTWSGEIPASATESELDYSMQFYVEASTLDGDVLLSDGSAHAPISLPVERGLVAGPFYSSAWFWLVVGGASIAVATAVTAIGIVATQPPESDLPIVKLPGGA